MNPARVFTPSVFGIIVLVLIALNSTNALAQRLWLHDEGRRGDQYSYGTPSGDDAAIKAPLKIRVSATHDYRIGSTSAHMRFYREDNPSHANKEQPLRHLLLDGQSPQPNAPSVEYQSTSAGYVVTVVYDHAGEYFYNHNNYYWIGTATVTLTDGDPVNQPDRYRVEFSPTRKSREPKNEEDAERFPPPPPVSGVKFPMGFRNASKKARSLDLFEKWQRLNSLSSRLPPSLTNEATTEQR